MRRAAQASDQSWTVIDLVRWGSEYFQAKEVDSPRLTIELMVCAVLDVTRLKLYMDFERPLTKDELKKLRAMVLSRVNGEPLQYIVGFTDFYSTKVFVDPNVLIPRPETEFLVDKALKLMKGESRVYQCLDVGTGSACIPIAIAKRAPNARFLAIDIEKGALEVAQRNIEYHGLRDQIELLRMDFLEESLNRRFDLITMNPPYISQHDVVDLQHEVRDYEPHAALTDGQDGLSFYKRMAAVASSILEPFGVLLMEIGYGQSTEVAEIFAQRGMSVEIDPDLQGIPRIATVRVMIS